MKTNYKFWYITKQDDVHISECGIRFFQTAITTENEKHLTEFKSVTRERLIKQLSEKDLKHLGKDFKQEINGQKSVIYTSKDFGLITTNTELCQFLDGELNKFK